MKMLWCSQPHNSSLNAILTLINHKSKHQPGNYMEELMIAYLVITT